MKTQIAKVTSYKECDEKKKLNKNTKLSGVIKLIYELSMFTTFNYDFSSKLFPSLNSIHSTFSNTFASLSFEPSRSQFLYSKKNSLMRPLSFGIFETCSL
jgi:hypothetical protein